jgi:hypothetical protein
MALELSLMMGAGDLSEEERTALGAEIGALYEDLAAVGEQVAEGDFAAAAAALKQLVEAEKAILEEYGIEVIDFNPDPEPKPEPPKPQPNPKDPDGDGIENFELFGKVTKHSKTPLNWFLLIVCFGWIWMAF